MKRKILQKKIAYLLTFILLLTNVYIGDFYYANNIKHYYRNDESSKNTVDPSFNLNFNDDNTDRATAGLSWKKDTDTGDYMLTLDNLYLEKTQIIILPTGNKVTIKLKGDNKIYSEIVADGDRKFNIIITGDGTLSIQAFPSGGIDNDTLTIEGEAKVYVKDRVSYGASGALNSFLNVKGEGTLLDIDSTASTNNKGTFLQEINVTDGAKLNIHAKNTSAFALGSINVKHNSALKVACKYGVYVINGKLTVDDTSTLETDAVSAGIVVVDTTDTKQQADVLSLPDIPYDSEIKSVKKTENSTTYTLWTIVKKGDEIDVIGLSQEQPADDITGALGKMTIKKRTDISTTSFTATLDKTQNIQVVK